MENNVTDPLFKSDIIEKGYIDGYYERNGKKYYIANYGPADLRKDHTLGFLVYEERKDYSDVKYLDYSDVKYLYKISFVEKELGFKKNGWHDARYLEKVFIKKFAYSDAGTLIKAIDKLPKKRLNTDNAKVLINSLKSNAERDEMNAERDEMINLPTLKEINSILASTQKLRKKKDAQQVCEKKLAAVSDFVKELNGSVKKGMEDRDFGIRFNSVFKDAKEIAEYGAIAEKEIELTKEICEIRSRISELQESLKIKEKESKDNRSLLGKYRKSLESNPLLSLNG